MTDNDFHARRIGLSNTFAAAGAELLDYMGCAGALAAIPNTQQYVVAGNVAAIRAQLDTVAPQRRMRHGDRPEQPLYFGPEAGQARRWAALITSAGHGILQEYGTPFEHAQPGQEVLEVMEILPGAATANKAAEEGELPALPAPNVIVTEKPGFRFESSGYTNLQMIEYARQAIAADRTSRQVANKAEVEPVGVIVADDPVHGWYMHALKPWNEIGAGTKLYATPPATTGASTVLTDERIAAIWHETACAEGEGTREHPAVFARAIEREVAAQAGQVAQTDLQVRRATDELSLPELAEQFAAVEALGCDYTLSAKVCGKLLRAMTTPPDDAAGQVAVPEQPTEAMLNAARDWSVKKYGQGIGNDAAIGCWKAMLAAAPSAPAVAQQAPAQAEPIPQPGDVCTNCHCADGEDCPSYAKASTAAERQEGGAA